jgi:hypothetical protein
MLAKSLIFVAIFDRQWTTLQCDELVKESHGEVQASSGSQKGASVDFKDTNPTKESKHPPKDKESTKINIDLIGMPIISKQNKGEWLFFNLFCE